MAIDLAWWSNKQEVEKIVTLIERERERESERERDELLMFTNYV